MPQSSVPQSNRSFTRSAMRPVRPAINHALLPTPQGPLQIPLSCVLTQPATANSATDNTHVASAYRRSAIAYPPALPAFSVVIPTYNESNNIAQLIAQLTACLDTYNAHTYELIVVDDNSPDRTWQIAQNLIGTYPQLRVMRRAHERGLSSAVIRGWQAAKGDTLAVIDADLQHPPEALVQLIKQTQQGADLAVASRHINGGGVSDWSLTRRFLSRGAQLLGLLVCPAVVSRVSDPMSGYFAVRRSAIAGFRLHPLGYKILLEVLGRGDIKSIAETGYVFQERETGDSKITWKHYLAYIRHLIRLRRTQFGPVRSRRTSVRSTLFSR